MKSICMNCKYFRIEDALSGYCRVKAKESEKGKAAKSMVCHDDTCSKWSDCGQQYYIRVGWVKALHARKSENSAN